MSTYTHPYKDVEFLLSQIVKFDTLCEQAELEGVNTELASAILDEAAKLGCEVLAPLNWEGDQAGSRLDETGVQQAPGFAEAYQQFAEGGWQSLTAEEEFGGQNLPSVLGTAVNEIWHSANLSYALCPLLTGGAIEAISHHGSEALKQTYLPKMVSGEWTGTMNLTEPDAGSDLAAVKTRAVPNGDHYLITGTKIFITWGDHQMTDNIVHLVLARLPDAPAGVKGISLFVVPKFLLDEQGNPGELNDVKCTGLEHKLGIHASPTCVMSFGDNEGAVGYLVGEPHQGLAYMFTMMNDARQGVGLQGLAVSERAYQHALVYAKERIQGTNKDGTRYPIIKFPDVRRMLMVMKSSCEAMRGLALVASAEIDRARYATTPDQKAFHQGRVDLLTPIVKGWMTELSQEVTYLGVQIHGGMGFVEETGAAQHYRDARILTIYEGTTGIQALDLVGRKTLMNQGSLMNQLITEIKAVQTSLAAKADLSSEATQLADSINDAETAIAALLDNAAEDRQFAGAISVNYMMLMGYLCGGWISAQNLLSAQALLDAGEGDQAFLNSKVTTARFYFDHLLPRTASLAGIVAKGSRSVMALEEDLF